LTIALGLAATFSHHAEFAKPAILALAGSVGANAVVEGLRAWMLRRVGAWMGMDGVRRTRAERPRMFRLWLGAHLIAAVIQAGAAGFLVWSVATG
jgi:hypothetical protein